MFVSDMPSSKIEEIKQAIIHPENDLLPDPNKPFTNFEEMFVNVEYNDEFIKMPILLTHKTDKEVLYIVYSQNQTYLLGPGLECGRIGIWGNLRKSGNGCLTETQCGAL